MFVISSYGHCVINGLGQVKVFSTRELAEAELAGLFAENDDKHNLRRGFEVNEVSVDNK